jgi:small conductance mechanosensitive channel
MEVPILAESWLDRHDHLLVALAAVVLTCLALWVVDRWFGHQLVHQAARVAGRELSPAADTRLRMMQRVAKALIVLLGVTVAVSQFTALSSFANALLASSALVAAVVGFAARQPVANAVAGIVLASSQPIRVGDRIVLPGGDTGTVEDVRLTSTVVRTPLGAHLIVPNETLVGSVVRNDSLPGVTLVPEADVWLPHGVDVAAARAAIEATGEGVGTSVAETNAEGYRLAVTAPAVPPDDRPARQAELRGEALAAVDAAGLHG